VRYIRIYSAEDGGSRFEDVEVKGEPAHIVDGIPPLLVSGPFPVNTALFVDQPKDATDWLAHVSPRRQWVILLSGRVAVTTTDGERREFSPGDVILAEDTTGQGHLSTPLAANVTFVMMPVTP
jgi:quercetin dioxygenase-like cupin family protein